MLSKTDQIIFGVFVLFILVMIIWLVLRVKKYKRITNLLAPTRILNSEDLKAIHFLDIEGNLSVNLLIFKRLPKKKIQKSVWQFSNISFQITSVYKYKRIIHHFFLAINGEPIEIVIPEIFLPYLTEGAFYDNKTIEILYRLDHFILYSIDGVIGYPSLYKKFQLEQKSIGSSSSKRRPTKEELKAFIMSKWTSVWGLILPFIFPMCLLAIMDEGPGISIVFLPFLLITGIPLYKAYKKRKKYIESRIIHTIKGTIWFDEEKYVYRIDENELKLHRKWKKVIKSKGVPIENVEMEAFLHTYDNLNLTVCHKFQPIVIKSTSLRLNESNLKSTPSWGIPFLYAIAFGFIVFIAPNYANKGNVIIDPRGLFNITENYVFVLLMTLVWWTSITITIYLSYLVINRVIGHYFYKEN